MSITITRREKIRITSASDDGEKCEISVKQRRADGRILMWWFINSDKDGKIFRDRDGWKRTIKNRPE